VLCKQVFRWPQPGKDNPQHKLATARGPGSTATIKELTVSDHEHDVGLGGIGNGHRGSHEDEQGRHFWLELGATQFETILSPIEPCTVNQMNKVDPPLAVDRVALSGSVNSPL
jgi:hypothetical protein